MAYDLHCEFDPVQHKETYPHYLEVVIDQNGKIQYAVPSHQEKMMSLASEYTGLERQEILDLCPHEFYCDMMTYLSIMSRAFPVWEDRCDCVYATKRQIAALKKLKLLGLYIGPIPQHYEDYPDWKTILRKDTQDKTLGGETIWQESC